MCLIRALILEFIEQKSFGRNEALAFNFATIFQRILGDKIGFNISLSFILIEDFELIASHDIS